MCAYDYYFLFNLQTSEYIMYMSEWCCFFKKNNKVLKIKMKNEIRYVLLYNMLGQVYVFCA